MSHLRPNRRKDRNKDQRARDFMEWVKTLPCVCCYVEQWRDWIEGDFAQPLFTALVLHGLRKGHRESIAAHIGGGMAAKASNWHTIPLCLHHHDSGAPDCEHVLKCRFGEHWGIATNILFEGLRAQFCVLFPEQPEL